MPIQPRFSKHIIDSASACPFAQVYDLTPGDRFSPHVLFVRSSGAKGKAQPTLGRVGWLGVPRSLVAEA
jgi:hypothetical protein